MNSCQPVLWQAWSVKASERGERWGLEIRNPKAEVRKKAEVRNPKEPR
jgi:hypothetical protein